MKAMKLFCSLLSRALSVGVVISITFVGRTPGVSAQNNSIFACVSNGSGLIRVVAFAGQCKNNETALSWNIQGVQGERGEPGEVGPSGVLRFYQVASETEIPNNSSGFGTIARCERGDVVTGGGHRYFVLDDGEQVDVFFIQNGLLQSHRVEAIPEGGEGWEVRVWNSSGVQVSLEVTAICADITP